MKPLPILKRTNKEIYFSLIIVVATTFEYMLYYYKLPRAPYQNIIVFWYIFSAFILLVSFVFKKPIEEFTEYFSRVTLYAIIGICLFHTFFYSLVDLPSTASDDKIKKVEIACIEELYPSKLCEKFDRNEERNISTFEYIRFDLEQNRK